MLQDCNQNFSEKTIFHIPGWNQQRNSSTGSRGSLVLLPSFTITSNQHQEWRNDLFTDTGDEISNAWSRR